MESEKRETRKRRSIETRIDTPQPIHSVTFNDWPTYEKMALLEALKKFGHYDIESLHKAVPGKTRDQIKTAISMWWKAARIAMQASASGNKQSKERSANKKARIKSASSPRDLPKPEKAPIDQWLQKLENVQQPSGYPQAKLISKAFLFISKFENHPPPESCKGIDFRALYEHLFCMLNGYPGRTLSPQTAAFLLESLNDLATELKAKGMHKETYFLERARTISSQIRQYGGKKKPESNSTIISSRDTLNDLLKIQGFNPLNVPVSLLEK